MAQKLISSQALDTVFVVLRLLCQDFPAVEADLDAAAQKLAKRFGFRGIQKDSRAIVAAVRDGYATVKDISERTGIPANTVAKRLAELVRAGILTTTDAPHAEGHGGDRSTKLYWLADRWRELFKARFPRQETRQVKLFDK